MLDTAQLRPGAAPLVGGGQGSEEPAEMIVECRSFTGRGENACWICLESDPQEELIAPCKCKGGLKWVHRRCLDRWRVDAKNPHNFTHCRHCNFPFLMVLMRAPTESDENFAARRRRFMGRLVGNFLLVNVAIQIWLIALGLLIRFCDKDEVLVEWTHEPSSIVEPGQKDFMDRMRAHKATYYLAACFVSLFLVGLSGICWLIGSYCCGCCGGAAGATAGGAAAEAAGGGARDLPPMAGGGRGGAAHLPVGGGGGGRVHYGGGGGGHLSAYEHWLCARCCMDCCECASDCCFYTCMRSSSGGGPRANADCQCCSMCGDLCKDTCTETCPGDCCNCNGAGGDCNGCKDCKEIFAVIALVLIVIIVLAGFIFLIIALVLWINKAILRYYQLFSLRQLTGEYVVQDLSTLNLEAFSEGDASAPPPAAAAAAPCQQDMAPSAPPPSDDHSFHPMSGPRVQQSLAMDLQAVYGFQDRQQREIPVARPIHYV
eukprot:TRINITY_DN10251_c0_g1_i1.p1 TRINITY_DN10251_c0_g1~~TRINITY_DN10251_c0_g1_i1.p1  ORF type:complete len:486 (+),score=94.05 TRINITY_DN10251_c0_g1_i1:69-1526(+)